MMPENHAQQPGTRLVVITVALTTLLCVPLQAQERKSLDYFQKSILTNRKNQTALLPKRSTRKLQEPAQLQARKGKFLPSDFGIEPIQSVKTDIQTRIEGGAPRDVAAELLSKETKIFYESRPAEQIFVQQQIPASRFGYRPLYFEELNLERHGTKVRCIQPLVSGIRFVSNFPLMPYKMTQQPSWKRSSTHDPYPSGLPAPWVKERGRPSPLGVTNELLAIAVAILVIP